MSGILTFLIFAGVIILTAVIFVVWVVAMIVRLLARGAFGLLGKTRRMIVGGGRQGVIANEGMTCGRRGCWARNPETARYCRRCGQMLPHAHRVVARRAAVW